MSELSISRHLELGGIRATSIDGEIFFVGKDIADVFGYSNPSKALLDYVEEDNLNIAELKSKVSYCDIILRCQDMFNISLVYKDYVMCYKPVNCFLRKLGVKFRQARIWLLCKQYAEHGYTKTYQNASGEECFSMHTKWMQKGCLFLYDALKAIGIYPKVEQGVCA